MIRRGFLIALGGLWTLAALTLADCAAAPPAQEAVLQPPPQPYTRLYVFGDSYSDMGYGLTYSNGPMAVAYLAKSLGLELTHPKNPDWQGKSLDFAISGAQTGESPPRNGRNGTGLINQVQDFTALVTSKQVIFDPDHTLFFVAGGLNDRNLTTEQTEANLTRIVTLLRDAGGKHFEIANLPEKIPAFSQVGIRLNPMLTALPAKLTVQLAVDVKPSRWGSYFDEVMTNAAALGFSNTTDFCAPLRLGPAPADAPPPCPDPEKHFYYNPDHPATAVHRLVGDKLLQELSR